ncbi:hypothetical protein [Alicyclobacillus macrosporangiidus]|nr:hypothetical protein [Alicyclobacillus macrosporangiidus]
MALRRSVVGDMEALVVSLIEQAVAACHVQTPGQQADTHITPTV